MSYALSLLKHFHINGWKTVGFGFVLIQRTILQSFFGLVEDHPEEVEDHPEEQNNRFVSRRLTVKLKLYNRK